jgi:glycerate kinase
MIERLTRRLDQMARRLPRDPRGRPLTGCAGGLSGGLWATFGAALVPGAAAVLEAVSFDSRVVRASGVVTGEGRIDQQSTVGKITGEIVRRCAELNKPVHAVAGASALSADELRSLGFVSVAEAKTLDEIRAAGASLVPPHRASARAARGSR